MRRDHASRKRGGTYGPKRVDDPHCHGHGSDHTAASNLCLVYLLLAHQYQLAMPWQSLPTFPGLPRYRIFPTAS